jgi:hypothetical protein
MYRLDEGQRSDFFSHLRTETNLFEEGCPACGTTDFYDFGLLNEVVADRTVEEVSEHDTQPGSPSEVPLVRLVCRSCSHILTFDIQGIEKLDL